MTDDEPMTDETHVTDLTPSYALGALPPDERAAVEAHLVQCADCRADLAEMSATVSTLPLAPENVEPRADLGARIVAAASRELAAKDVLTGSAGKPAQPVRSFSPARQSWFTSVPVWVGAVGVAAALVMVYVSSDLTRQRNAMRADVAGLNAQVASLRASNALLGAQTQHDHLVMTALASGDYWTFGPAKDRNGAMWRCAIVQPPASGHNGMLLASVPEPPRGMAYQVWVKRKGAMHKAGMLMHGGMSMVDMDMPVQRGDEIAFSIEPMHGSAAPTTPLLMESVL
jgi:anti-sigma-K factor RskA